VDGIESVKKGQGEPKSLQEYHEMLREKEGRPIATKPPSTMEAI